MFINFKKISQIWFDIVHISFFLLCFELHKFKFLEKVIDKLHAPKVQKLCFITPTVREERGIRIYNPQYLKRKKRFKKNIKKHSLIAHIYLNNNYFTPPPPMVMLFYLSMNFSYVVLTCIYLIDLVLPILYIFLSIPLHVTLIFS